MQKEYGTAIGMIETLGMVPAIYGADFMLKAADVELISYENLKIHKRIHSCILLVCIFLYHFFYKWIIS